jgi:hypothetical protein
MLIAAQADDEPKVLDAACCADGGYLRFFE